MKTLSFVIPVYNEKERLSKTFAALKKGISYDGMKLEKIIFVNDGSTDSTFAKLAAQQAAIEKATGAQVEILSYACNQGKGYAVRMGMTLSKSDYTLFFDADMSTPLVEFNKMLPFIKKGVDVLVGTRKNGHSTVIKHQPLYRELLGRCFTLMSQIILDTWVTDFTCGFKAFSRKAKKEIFAQSKINRWSYDSEILYIARRLGYKLQEVPVLWKNDERTKVNLLKDLPRTLTDLLVIRLGRYDVQSNIGLNRAASYA